MAKAKKGDRVKVHYTGRTDEGEVFETTQDRKPLDFTVGDGKVNPEVEKAVMGMEVGESKVIKILSQQAYGPYRQDMVVDVEKSIFPKDQEPVSGHPVLLHLQDGKEVVGRIVNVEGDTVTLDTNHPLAGRDINLDIMLAEIL